ncbi:MAG TPA: hypothetical protein VK666_05100 [Chryseolinea sp.]|nr:hypothetical protein [Chryseolinea sp.]
MNKIYVYILGLIFIAAACVDDYKDANPTHPLDAPFLRISGAGANQKVESVPVNPYQNTYLAYATYGSTVEFTVTVVDAPGKVNGVTVVPSVPDYGTVTLDNASVSNLMGQDKGEFKFTFTPNPALPDMSDRAMNLVVTVDDNQTNQLGEPEPVSTILTMPTNLVACISEDIEEGTYEITAASGNFDGGATYTLDTLKKDGEVDHITLDITADRPGLYSVDEITGGVWPIYYSTRANPVVGVDLCGSDIKGHEGATVVGGFREFDVSGLRNSDGTITITWSYKRIDATPTPANPAKGTYTLHKLD